MFKISFKNSTFHFYLLLVLLSFSLLSCSKPLAPKSSKAKIAQKIKSFFQDVDPSWEARQKIPVGNAYYYYVASKIDSYEGNPDLALERLKESILQNNNPSAFLTAELSRYQIDNNEIEEALQNALKASELNPQDLDNRVLLAKLYSALKQSDKSIQEFNFVLNKNSSHEDARLGLVAELLNQKKYEAALKQLKILKQKNSDNEEVVFYLSEIYLDYLHKPKEAILELGELLKEEPNHEKALLKLGQIYTDQNLYAQALEVYEKLYLIKSEDISVLTRLGTLSYELKKEEMAIHYFNKILKQDPTQDRIQYYLALIYSGQKKWDLSIQTLQKIATQSAFFKDAAIKLASIYEILGKREQGIDYLEKGLKERKDISEFYDALASLYFSSGKKEEALKKLKEGYELFPKNEKILFSLSLLLDKSKQFEEAEIYLKKLLELNPKHVNALNYLGYSYAEKNIKLDEAILYLERALNLKPKDAYILDSLAWAYFKKGNLKLAKEYLEQAIQLNPKESAITEHLGDVYKALNQNKKALSVYEKTLQLLKENAQSERQRILEKMK